jgi:tRNA A58 N-methylase Trm61
MVKLDVPWWTYGAVEVVDAFLQGRPGARVFEYGSGASTIWLARRAGRVTSVEHDAGWYDRMRTALALCRGCAPIDLHLVPPDVVPDPDPLYRSAKSTAANMSFRSYARHIDMADASYDLIVVDGRARPDCLHHALARLAPEGMIVFDNSHRGRYRLAIQSSGLHVRRFRGRAPALPYPDETALLVNTGT